MSTSHVRLVVAGLSLILAVLTGLVTGFAGGGSGCEPSPSGSVPNSPAASHLPGGGPGVPSGPAGQQPTQDSEPNQNPSPSDRFNTGFPPPAGNALTVSSVNEQCNGDFSPLTAILGFGGALFTALVAAGIALFLPRQAASAASAPGPGGRGGPASASYGAVPTSGPPGGRAIRTPTGSYPVLGDPVASGSAATQPVTRAGAQSAGGTTLTAGGESDRQLAADRRTLVDTAIYVRDRATSKAIADRLAWALTEVGVVEVRPDGGVFDTAQHEAGGTAPTDDARLDGTVAAVEISGYTDRGKVVRAPVVTVFRAGAR
jgi:hypothetical protein